ncbi:MFS transporter [Arthrobacter sp. ERGS1:01]|uniref:MFS transporter n=1 Tax=Arthrobacter sp. ERGS1:01 TaxID=1704044 RepID=UPI001ED9AF12|nr:MFS transporter [Arthrobacter sp. ERGS1:01]
MLKIPVIRAGLPQWLALAVLTLPVLLIAVDSTVLGFAVPALTEALRPSGVQLLWIVDIYSFMLAGLLVTMGTLGDRIGRRRLLLIGSAGFGAASALTAYSSSPEMLIAARAVLGCAGATLMPSTLSILRHLFHNARQRRLAIAIWSATASGGAALGPILGGFLLEHFWWGSVFLINAPVMVLILIAAPLLVPESKDPHPGKYDLPSAALSLAAILPVIYGIKMLAADGPAPMPAFSLVVGLLLGAAFIRRQKRLADPMIDVRLFTNATFSAGVVINLFSVFALVGVFFVVTQYLQLVLGLGPLEAALWLMPAMVAEALSALAGVWLVRLMPLNRAVCLGLVLAGAGIGLSTLTASHPFPGIIFVGFLLLGLGSGLAYALSNDAIIAAVNPERAGAAAAVSETAYELGAALGVAILGTVLNTGYRSGFLPGAGVSTVTASQARETLGAARVLAESLPLDQATLLMDAGRSAFLNGMFAVGLVAVTILGGTAIFSLFWFREKN